MIPVSLRPSILTELNSDVVQMRDHFNHTSRLPKQLVSQNGRAMQQAFVCVPIDLWTKKLEDLEEALNSYGLTDHMRRNILTRTEVSLLPTVNQIINAALLEKYDELMLRVKHDFNGFFPYRVCNISQNLIVFEKLEALHLVKFVVERL